MTTICPNGQGLAVRQADRHRPLPGDTSDRRQRHGGMAIELGGWRRLATPFEVAAETVQPSAGILRRNRGRSMNEVASTLQARQEITEGIYRDCGSLNRMDREFTSTVFHPSAPCSIQSSRAPGWSSSTGCGICTTPSKATVIRSGTSSILLQRRWIVGHLGVLCDCHTVEGCERFKDGDPGRRTGSGGRWRSAQTRGMKVGSLGPLSGQVVVGRRRLGNRSPGVCRRHQDRDGGGRSRRGRPTRPGKTRRRPAGRDPGVRTSHRAKG